MKQIYYLTTQCEKAEMEIRLLIGAAAGNKSP
jgi:hypothetical protein